MVDSELSLLRQRCHEELDFYWQSGYMTRPQFYKRISQILKTKGNRGSHIKYLSKDQCQRILRAHREGRFLDVSPEIYRKPTRSLQRQ